MSKRKRSNDYSSESDGSMSDSSESSNDSYSSEGESCGKTLRVLSLFSGIGGFELGMKMAGLDFKVVAFCEYDKYASQVLAHHWPKVKNLGDITKVNWAKAGLGRIDMIVGGSPCQDLSSARCFQASGKTGAGRRGLEGEKSSLFFKFVDAIKHFSNADFMLENVASMRIADRATMTEILAKTRKQVWSTNVCSTAFTGVRRRRILWTTWAVPECPMKPCGWVNKLIPFREAKSLEWGPRVHRYMGEEIGTSGRTRWQNKQYQDTSFPVGTVITRTLYKGLPLNLCVDRRRSKSKPLMRKLAPLELERMMGFPEGWTNVGLSATRRYMALGNAVVPACIAFAFKPYGKMQCRKK